jgi:hypothetical protein
VDKNEKIKPEPELVVDRRMLKKRGRAVTEVLAR